MKTLALIKVFFLLLLISGSLHAQNVIYSEDFNDDVGKGFDGDILSDITGVDWTLDVDACTFTGDGDYVKVVATGDDRLEALDCDGEAIWKSSIVDISVHTDISISIFTGETGSGATADNKYIKLYYILDGGLEISFFESSVDWGSATASISNLNGSSLQLVARMKTTYASDKIYIDDISVTGTPGMVSRDALTLVLVPDNQIPSQNINSIINDFSSAQSLLKFNLSEPSGDDDLDTKIASIKFSNVASDNIADLSSQFGGFAIHDGSNLIPASSVEINTDEVILNFAEGNFTLLDDSFHEYELRAYLKLSGIIDGNKVKIELSAGASGITTYQSGSTFDTAYSEAVVSPEHLISVVGTNLHFISIPTNSPIKNTSFSVSLDARDINGNVDLDAYQNIDLSLESGNGILEGVLTDNLSSGQVTFNDLSYNLAENINIKAEASDYISVISDPISIISSQTTDLSLPAWIPSNSKISSLSNLVEDAIEVFRFSVNDKGDDLESTFLNALRFVPGDNNSMSWEENIAGIELKVGETILDAGYTFDNSAINISISDTELLREISEGTSRDYSIFVYLKTTLTDLQILQLQIENTHEGWGTSGSGLLPSFIGDLAGLNFTIDVQGTELVFTNKPPRSITPNVAFEMGLKTIDKYGNQDLSSVVEARVSLASGSGELSTSSGLNTNLIEGEFSWNDLIYNAAENFTILIEADGMIPVLSDNISSLDANSLIIPSNFPVESVALNPMATSSDNSEIIFKFSVIDFGTLDDDPTIITTMKFYNKLSGEGLDWKKHIAGCSLIKDGELIAKTVKIEDDFISFTSLDVEVVNASQSEFELGVYFKKSLIPDKAQLQVEIRKEHGWKASSTASNFMDELTDDIISAIHHLDVRADRFSFISVPIGVNTSESFSVEIAAVDAHQNIDKDNNSSVNLSLQTGEGTLNYSGLVGNLSNGLFILNDITYSGSDFFELAVSGDLIGCSESIFIQEDNIIFSDYFESTDLSKWENNTDWKVSSYLPIKGNSSLKHNLSNAIGSSYISCPLVDVNLKSESIFWEFTLKNSDWDPSSSNKFVYHLLMDFSDPGMANNLFSVGINLSGTDDLLSLWKTQSGDSELLLKSDFDWNEDETVAVKLEYTARGEWELYYNRLGEMKNWFSAGTIISEIPDIEVAWFSGLEFHYGTASRAGELWFDDLKIESCNTAPYFRSYVLSSDSIILDFSEDLNFTESSKNENFELKRGDDLFPIKLINESVKKNQLILFTENEFLTGQYYLSISGMVDMKGAISNIEEIEFDFFADAKAHNLVINEILADETPIVGLPEYEFVEIYNASDYPINIKDYKLKVGNTEKILSDFEIPSHAYLILCSNAAFELYNAFGNSLGLTSFPSLTNSGTSISLESSSGVLIDEISYSSDWYGDEGKKNGGWSLERIDVTNHSWQADNWRASMDEKGGTPGEINSIEGYNPDVVPPSLLNFEVSQSNSIDLFFSETLETSQAFDIQNYSLSRDIGHPSQVVVIENNRFALRLKFESDFEHNILYQLHLSDLIVDLAGNSIDDKELEFSLADLPQEGDLVINEVLFNPYPGGADYIELLNISDQVIDIRDISIANRDDNFELDAVYQLTTEYYMLDAGSYLLLSTDTLSVKENYSYLDDNAFMQINKMPSYNDAEGRVVILNSNNEQLDDFAYNENMHFQGLTSTEGVSLERINPNNETNLTSNWISAAQSIGFGTPGLKNSSYDIDETVVNVVGFKSKTFSPDNDGVDDRLIINFDLEKSGYVANIRVYNSFGREVRRLASNLTLSTNDELYWDGLLASKARAPIGIYVFYFELYHPDGEVKAYKKTCVLGGKMK
ncbi:lamin tail domain-containing protein [Ancylomarina sp. YFZ004]